MSSGTNDPHPGNDGWAGEDSNYRMKTYTILLDRESFSLLRCFEWNPH